MSGTRGNWSSAHLIQRVVSELSKIVAKEARGSHNFRQRKKVLSHRALMCNRLMQTSKCHATIISGMSESGHRNGEWQFERRRRSEGSERTSWDFQKKACPLLPPVRMKMYL